MRGIGIILLAIFCQASFADVTPSHAIQGFLVTVPMVKLAGGDRTDCLVWGSVGAVIGALPDLMGAYGNLGGDNWKTYRSAHSPKSLLAYLPQYRLHLWIDSPFHDRPGNWWSRKWPLCVMIWAIEAVLIYLTVRWLLDE